MSHLSSENLLLLLAVEECLKDLGMSVIILFFSRSVCMCAEGQVEESPNRSSEITLCVWSEVISHFMKCTLHSWLRQNLHVTE